MKSKQYWNEIEQVAREVYRISAEIQGPIIDEHLEGYDLETMGVEELTNAIAEFYTEEQHQMWDNLDEKSMKISEEYQVDPNELATDVWSILTMLQDADNLSARH